MYLQIYSSGLWDDTYLTGSWDNVYDDKHGFICEWDTLKKYLSFSKDSILLYVGCSGNIEYKVSPTQNVTVKSDNEEVLTIDKNGNIKALKAGTAIVTATAEDGQTNDCLVTVINETSKIKLKDSKVTLTVGSKYTLEASIYPEDSSEYAKVVWSSKNKAIATVSNKGVVTAKK